MLRTPDPAHWWHLVFIHPVACTVVCAFVTEADELDIALFRAELNGARPRGCDLAATPFRATYVHPDYTDVPLSHGDLMLMPVPQGLTKIV